MASLTTNASAMEVNSVRNLSSDARRASSMRFASVRSCMILTKPMIVPSSSRSAIVMPLP